MLLSAADAALPAKLLQFFRIVTADAATLTYGLMGMFIT
jgi:hypothetical protein